MKRVIGFAAFLAAFGAYAWNTGDFGVPLIATVCLGLIEGGRFFEGVER